MKSTGDSDTCSAPRSPDSATGGRCRQHSPVGLAQGVRARRGGHCNRRKWVDSAVTQNERFSEGPAQESDYTHDAGLDLFLNAHQRVLRQIVVVPPTFLQDVKFLLIPPLPRSVKKCFWSRFLKKASRHFYNTQSSSL